MKIKFVLLFLCGVLVISCGEDTNSTQELETTEDTEQNRKITAKTIESLNYKDYALSSESESAVVTWERYHELATQIGYLKKADFSFFNGDIELLKKFIEEFKTQMPDQFRVNPIVSRSAIVETELLKLNENLTLDNIKRSDKLLSIKMLFVSFSNLNYQINEKLESDFYDKIQPE
ncbi:hypothetical protein ADIWIN_2732 [Winogradskyella psychrotolerans RS-3]|uniref:Uncharacterized protein n=1 Tax=Winogradskyella psychrotolerans RS-3 TaxID=641526 RepID=S7VSB5_9FLAO|nr:hypothetical protein [Winogradskyella psychrotolerans]EPR72232.1 hypothetical protein ADIWIN_2732 [Winogradskyella psychrotolerans RS-3]